MSDQSQGPGWWQASDDRWYPPEQRPGAGPAPAPAPAPMPTVAPPPAPVTPPTAPPAAPPKAPRSQSVWALIGTICIVVIAALVIVGNAPDTDGYESDTSAALLRADLNENDATGAPQQAVVNGWVARDLLEIEIKQNNDLLQQQFVLGLGLLVAVGMLTWTALNTRRSA